MLKYIPPQPRPAPVDLEIFANRLKVLAEPNRLQILEMIIQGVQCNCELGDALKMAPNLISHHLSKLREAGFVNVERDPIDARWMYYSINQDTLDELNAMFGVFFDPKRILPRRQTCGPQTIACSDLAVTSKE